MATYREMQAYIKKTYGFSAQSCWIAHVKKLCGLEVKPSPNRHSLHERVKPCPQEKQDAISQTLRHFDMI